MNRLQTLAPVVAGKQPVGMLSILPSNSSGIRVSIALAQIACPAGGRWRRFADALAALTHREAAL